MSVEDTSKHQKILTNLDTYKWGAGILAVTYIYSGSGGQVTPITVCQEDLLVCDFLASVLWHLKIISTRLTGTEICVTIQVVKKKLRLYNGKYHNNFSRKNQDFFPNIKSHIDLVGCVMSVERTSVHQKTPTKKALKHISEVLEYFQLSK